MEVNISTLSFLDGPLSRVLDRELLALVRLPIGSAGRVTSSGRHSAAPRQWIGRKMTGRARVAGRSTSQTEVTVREPPRPHSGRRSARAGGLRTPDGDPPVTGGGSFRTDCIAADRQSAAADRL